MDNQKLAQFITNLSQFNDYDSTVAQTQKLLSFEAFSPLNANNDDKGIKTVFLLLFDAQSIITINGEGHYKPLEIRFISLFDHQLQLLKKT